MEATDNLITAIVLTWNSEKFITKCIRSLEASSLKPIITVVDNDSSDNTIQLVKKHFPEVRIINTGSNLGYAGGNNVGIEDALSNGSKYIFILNPDAFVDENCIEKLYKRLEKNASIGGVSPKIYFDGTDTLWFAGSDINWRTGVTTQHGGLDTGQFDKVLTTSRLNGCAMMLPARTIREVGLMDSSYFLYYEETDWSVLCKRAGYELGFVSEAKAWHKTSSSTGGYLSPLYQYYMTRNRLYFVKKFKPRYLLFTYTALIRANLLTIYAAVRKTDLKTTLHIVRSILHAHHDFLAHKQGKQSIPA